MATEGIITLEQRTAEQIIKDKDLAIKEERFEDAIKFRDELQKIQWKETTKQRTTEQITTEMNIAAEEDRFEDAIKLRDELQKIQWKEITEPSIIDTAQSVIDEAAEEEHKKEITDATAKEEQDKEEQIKALTEQLNGSTDKNEKLENDINLLRTWLNKIRTDRTNKIEEIKNANTTDIEKLKADLKKMTEEKTKLENDFFGKVTFKDNIKEEDIKKITSRMIRMGVRETDKRGRKTLVWYQTMPIRMTRRRMTIKTMANMFNEIKDNPTEWVDFVMAFTKTRFGRYMRQEDKMTRRAMLRKLNIGRNLETFGTKYNKQKEKMMNVLTWGINKEELPPEEQIVIKAIEQRIDYYGKKYLQNTFNQTIGKPSK